MMRKTISLLIIMCALTLGLPAGVAAQITGGALRGVVRNQLNEPVAGAKVTSTNRGTNQTRSTVTDEEGIYRLPALPIGTYEISVESDSYLKAVQQVTLRVNEDASVDIQLSASGSTEQVNIVSSSAAITETSSSVLGIVIENKQMNELPLNGRNFLQLGTLVANVSSTAALKGGAEGGLLNGPFAVAGQRDRSLTFLVDGVDNNNSLKNSLSAQVSIDAIQEFKLLTNLGSAEFGHHSGGMLNIITKSGTNDFHASVFEFFRNKALNSPNHFETLAGQTPSKFNNNQFGGTLGGRLIKDQAFFLVNYEGQRLRVGTPQFSNVPTLAERSGLFKNPATGQSVQLSVDPVAQNILDRYIPLPNTQNVLGNYLATPTIRSTSNFLMGRVDYLLSGDDVINVRYFVSDLDTFSPIIANVSAASGQPPTIPGFGLNDLGRTHNLAINHTHNFSTEIINDFRFGYNRHHNTLNPEDTTNPSDLGFTNVTSSTGMFDTLVPGITRFGNVSLYPLYYSMGNFHVSNSLSFLKGRHSLKTGAEARFIREAETASRAGAGQLVFTGAITRISPLADFVTGAPSASLLAAREFGTPLRQTNIGVFVQDDYQVSHRLVLNLGFRYELSTVLSDPTHKLKNYSIARGFFTPGMDGSSLFEGDHNNFAPRFGFAYTLTGDGRTVMRGGYGIFYDTIAFSNVTGMDLNRNTEDPYVLVSPFAGAGKLSSLFNPATLTKNLGALNVRSMSEEFRTPYAQHFNLTFQRELSRNILISGGYVGTKGTKLLRGRDVNQAIFLPGVDAQGKPLSTSAAANILARRPTQLYGLTKTPVSSVLQDETSASSIYHSLQATLTMRVSHGLSLLSAYTWAKAIDDASDPIGFTGDGGYPQNSYDLRQERGLSIFDIRHRFTVGYTYELPVLGKTRWLTGWQVNGIATFQSGQPFTPLLGFDSSLSTSGANARPNHVPGAIISKDGQLSFNPNLPLDPARKIPAALIPNPGEFGTLGRNTFTGPGYTNVDVSLIKSTRLSEGVRMQIRGELFNVFNTVNLALPSRTLTDPFFGLSRKTQDVAGGVPGIGGGGPRVVQLAVKLVY